MIVQILFNIEFDNIATHRRRILIDKHQKKVHLHFLYLKIHFSGIKTRFLSIEFRVIITVLSL